MRISKKQIRKNVLAWIAALRSGKYKQTRGTLKYQDGFCCLGVACDLLLKTKQRKKIDCGSFLLDETAVKAFGLTAPTGGFDMPVPAGGWNNLANLNDMGRWSFKKIAKFIESNPKGLFQEGIFEEGKIK